MHPTSWKLFAGLLKVIKNVIYESFWGEQAQLSDKQLSIKANTNKNVSY